MFPTPDLSHLTAQDYQHVYEPAEDTFVLLDALEQDAQELQNNKPLVCLELGSGSGCVSSFLGSIVGPSSALYLTTDINMYSSRCTRLTGRQNKIPLEPITASLFSPLLPRLRHAVDILVFNPPYVPTYVAEADEAQSAADIQGSWAGGHGGMQITNIVLDAVSHLLSPSGQFYLVAVKQNDPLGICRRMLQEHDLQSQVILQRRAGREHLSVIRMCR